MPFGTALGTFVAGQAVQAYGWRTTFVLVGLPGLLVAALVALTIKEPPRGLSDHGGRAAAERAPRRACSKR